MNTSRLVSRRHSCPMLLHRDAFTGAETRLASRLAITIPASSRHLGSVRAIQWCTGWPWHGRRRVDRQDRMDEMSRNFQELYSNLSRMNRLKLARHHYHNHHNHWHRWSKYGQLSGNRGRWRGDRDREERVDKRDGFDDIIKRIEADPYEFLFGRSNQYLRLPKTWSQFCRSFLDLGSTSDAKQKTSSAGEKAAKRSTTDDDKHTEKVSSNSSVADSITPAVHSQELQFDPISGRMMPRNPPVEGQATNQKEAMDSSVNTFPSSEISSSEKHDLPADEMDSAASQSTSKKDIIYLEDTNNSAQKSVDEKPLSPDSVVVTQKPEVGQETSSTISAPKIRQLSDFEEDEDINQLSASDIRASFASRNENSNVPIEPPPRASTDQVNEAVKGFSGSMQLLNQELMDLCERLESSAFVEPDLYRVLAYDPSTSEVVIAETISSVYATGKALPPSEVMLNINNPAKFLPYFAKMKTDGYEIVSGGGNILVFRKGLSNGDSDFNYVQTAPSRISNMPIGSSQAETATDEKPQPIINQTKKTNSSSAGSTTPRMVRRQETVYTGGPPNWSPYPPPPSSSNHLDEEVASTAATKTESPQKPSSVGKAVRRVFLTGFATAGVFYAVGVVCEYFRTGGQDGLGPVGFTAFEADRRQRE